MAAVLAGMALLSSLFSQSAPHASAQTIEPSCEEWDIDYDLSASLELSDTPMGQGDGIYPIGPGHMVLRFEDQRGNPGGLVKMVSYSTQQDFRVVAKTLFWRTTVDTRAVTFGVIPSCGPAEGALTGTTLTWSTPVNGIRTDGTLDCNGSFCGKFGAPPAGQSALHIGPNPVLFLPFRFSRDMKTFTMASTLVARTEAPRQTSHLALAGREASRICRPKTCP
jgi:hypothetical protein